MNLAKMVKKTGVMRLTIEQRVRALERENVVLQDTLKLLHKLLKEQRGLINEYITHNVASSSQRQWQESNGRLPGAVYTFRCKERFDRIEKQIEKIHKKQDRKELGLKAG